MNKNVKNFQSNRILYFDYLRIFAVFAVIILYVSVENMWQTIGTNEFFAHLAYNSAVRWVVPVFVMISGALFLDPKREIYVGRLHKKNLLRLVTAFMFWSAMYALVDYLEGVRLRDVVFNAVKGHVHLCYLYMLAGLYLVVPVLRKVTESKKLTKYFLILWLLIAVGIPTVSCLAAFVGAPYQRLVTSVEGSLDFRVAAGYAGYFVLGYALNHFDFSRAKRAIVYILGVCGFAATFILPVVYYKLKGIPFTDSFGNLTVNVFFETVSVFVFFKYAVKEKTGKKHTVIRTLSDCSFGIYLVHLLVLEFGYNHLGVSSLAINPILSIPVVSVCVFAVSFVITFILKKIPFVKQYLV